MVLGGPKNEEQRSKNSGPKGKSWQDRPDGGGGILSSEFGIWSNVGSWIPNINSKLARAGGAEIQPRAGVQKGEDHSPLPPKKAAKCKLATVFLETGVRVLRLHTQIDHRFIKKR